VSQFTLSGRGLRTIKFLKDDKLANIPLTSSINDRELDHARKCLEARRKQLKKSMAKEEEKNEEVNVLYEKYLVFAQHN